MKLPTRPNLLSLSTNEIRPSSLNRARAHTSRVHARSPMRLVRRDLFLSLFLFFSPLSLSVPRDRFHGEHFQLSIVRTSLDNPLWDPSLGYLRFWSPLSAASLGPTDSRRLPRQRDWNLFIALADRHSRTLIGGSNRGTPWRRDGATRWRVQRGGGEQRKGEHANSAGCNYSDLWRRDDGEKCRRPPVIIGGGWPPLSIRHLFYFLLILPPWRMSNGASTLSSGLLSAFFLALYRSTTRRREVQG